MKSIYRTLLKALKFPFQVALFVAALVALLFLLIMLGPPKDFESDTIND